MAFHPMSLVRWGLGGGAVIVDAVFEKKMIEEADLSRGEYFSFVAF